MRYAFETLVSVSFNHSYFSNQKFGGLTLEPSELTSRVLQNHGLMIKQFEGGFHILFDKHFAGGTRDKAAVLKEDILCQFALRLNDKGFYNYTEPVEGDINTSIFYFHNTFKNSPNLKKSLHSDKYAGSQDLVPLESFEEKYFVKPFAKLDLQLSEGLEETYSITFKAKETYWRYILVSDALKSLNSPAIIDSVSSESFDGPETLPVRGKDTLAFRSKKPISFNQVAKNVFQLVDNYDAESGRYKVVMRALPSADPNNITLIESNTNNRTLNYSEIFIH
jgi:hypothetical protein